MIENPLLAYGTLPRFDEITADHVQPAVERTLADAEAAFATVETRAADLDAVGLVHALEPIDDRVGWLWTLVNHLNGVRTTDPLRAAIEAAQPQVVTFSARMSQSRPIYQALRRVRDAASFAEQDTAVKRAVTLRLQDAEHAGVGLPADAREAFNADRQALAKLSMDFGNHVLDATKAFALVLTDAADVAGLPESALALAAQSARAAGEEAATPQDGPWRITLDTPSYMPFMEFADARVLREQLYRAFVTRATRGELDNLPLIEQILTLRRRQAQALGFETFAELSVASKMAPSVDKVSGLLTELFEASRAAAQDELDALTAFSRANGGPDTIALWDVYYWARRVRQDRFAYSEEDLRPYFALPRVLDGLFALAGRLFGVSFAERYDVQTWHDDVRYFEVRDDDGAPIAGFFLDAYSRPANKRGGAWMNDCLGRSRQLAPEGADVRLPVAYLVCNQAPPVDGRPSLMSFREVNTLFHEFGHGLHHMLTRVDISAVAGISGVEWDAVELPSQFMENWVTHRPTLLGFARHWQTGAPMPDDLVDRLLASKTFRAGSAFLRQLYFARLDLTLHHDFDPAAGRSILDVQREVAATQTVLTPLPEDRFLCAFTHLFAGGYAAGYYSYKWAEVLSADAFSAFEEAGLDDDDAVRATGRRFRDTVLSLGGSVPPMDVFEQFRGRAPSTAPLLRHNGLAA